jgi:hypothetical protein
MLRGLSVSSLCSLPWQHYKKIHIRILRRDLLSYWRWQFAGIWHRVVSWENALMMEAVPPLKRRFTSTRLHGAMSQKAVIFILAAVRTWNLTQLLILKFIWLRGATTVCSALLSYAKWTLSFAVIARFGVRLHSRASNCPGPGTTRHEYMTYPFEQSLSIFVRWGRARQSSIFWHCEMSQ